MNWERLLISKNDGSFMGTPEEVLNSLNGIFPNMTWELETERRIHVRPYTVEYLKEWMKTFRGMQPPYYIGYINCIGLFQFKAAKKVKQIHLAFAEGQAPEIGVDAALPLQLRAYDWQINKT